MHSLKLYINQYQNDLSVLPVTDISVYDAGLPKQQPILQIQAPNSDKFVTIAMGTWAYPFFAAITTIKLGISTTADDLPDGIYRINYSLSPHAITNTELVHYRIEKLRAAALKKAAGLYLRDTEIDPFGNMSKEKSKDILNTVFVGMRAVQQLCQIHGDYEEAGALYERIDKLLNTIENV